MYHLTRYSSFVCGHLTAHAHLLESRLKDYHYIVSTLLFPPLPGQLRLSTIYDTSHLFFLGDLNFRISLPETHELASSLKGPRAAALLDMEDNRELLKEFDQLYVEQRRGTCFTALREGEFWKFKCSYKYLLGEVDKYR
jgi:hypothetical protein